MVDARNTEVNIFIFEQNMLGQFDTIYWGARAGIGGDIRAKNAVVL